MKELNENDTVSWVTYNGFHQPDYTVVKKWIHHLTDEELNPILTMVSYTIESNKSKEQFFVKESDINDIPVLRVYNEDYVSVGVIVED